MNWVPIVTKSALLGPTSMGERVARSIIYHAETGGLSKWNSSSRKLAEIVAFVRVNRLPIFLIHEESSGEWE